MKYNKISIEGTIEIITGLHIGGSKEFSAIGAVDTPVIYDPLSKLPMIPGSSIKGKLRTLLARRYNKNPFADHKDDSDIISRIFGSSNKQKGFRGSRILVSDSILTSDEEKRLKNLGVDDITEVKFENTIKRTDGVANPRQIERVIRGAQFPLHIIYDVFDEEEALEDLKLIKEGFELLENDYIGGHGSRGYGRVKFTDIQCFAITDDCSDGFIEEIEKLW